MKEILANSLTDVTYQIFKNGVLTDATGNVTVNVYKDGVKLVSAALATKDAGLVGKYRFTLPMSVTVGLVTTNLIIDEGYLDVEWTFTVSGTTLSVKENYEVVTPYSPWSYFSDAAVPPAYNDYLECEKISRYLINSFCGQSFGKRQASYPIEGRGTDGLQLPWRLISLDDVSWVTIQLRPGNLIGLYGYPNWEIATDGWMLRAQPNSTQIDAAYRSSDLFVRNIIYNVKGIWGYNYVPGPIQEASKILIADYLCEDHKYRDKYLQSLKMQDWRIQFADAAFRGTGNATADNLLLDYRNYPGVAII